MGLDPSDKTNKLIFDLGFHKGEDTRYYLSKGYRVIAVDADPGLVLQANLLFSDALRKGTLVLLNCAVGAENGETDFYLSDTSIWNSLTKKVADRGGNCRGTIRVPMRRLPDLFSEYGVPFYCKIDLEGWDIVCLHTLEGASELPEYISVESECIGDKEELTEAQALGTLEQLNRLGYRRFKLVDQRELAVLSPSASVFRKLSHWQYIRKRLGINGHSPYKLNRLRLSQTHHYTFPIGASGPFGPDLEGEWLDIREARRTLLRHRNDYYKMPDVTNWGFWCDWHATI